MTARPRVVVLASGGGTNLQALLDAVAARELHAEIVAVVSDQAHAYALERSRIGGVPAVALLADAGEIRADYDVRLGDEVATHSPTLVVLAGFMRILTPSFLSRFRVINLHPALPDAFPGTRAIERAFAEWQDGNIDSSGVMVHWVPDAGVDNGPVIATAEVAFRADDTLATFEERMHLAEHQLLVDAVRQVLPELQAPTPHIQPTEPQREAIA